MFLLLLLLLQDIPFEYVPHQVLVTLERKPDEPSVKGLEKLGEIGKICRDLRVKGVSFPFRGPLAEAIGLDRVCLIEYESAKDPESVSRIFKETEGVQHAEPNYYYKLFVGDPLFPHQWGLHNIGQPYFGILRRPDCEDDSLILKTGIEDADIDFREAWNFLRSKNQDTVILGLIDTGVDLHHPEIENRIWTNGDEIPGNGIDDDNNGYIDDYNGWDFSGEYFSFYPEGDNDPTDYHGHGTHLAGIISSETNNAFGIAGLSEKTLIMPIKVFPNSFTTVIINAILYSMENGAEILNLSWGSPYPSHLLKITLESAMEKGIVIVAAAGNSGETEDPGLAYPAKYSSVIAVGASDSRDRRASFSSYGEELDFIAPGVDVLSLRAAGTDMYGEGSCPEPNVHIVDSIFYIADGTSMAAPFFAGCVSLVLSISKGLKPHFVYDLFKNTADDILDPNNNGSFYPGWDPYSGYGRVNLIEALMETPEFKAIISYPEDGEIIEGGIDVIGTASGENFSFYILSAGEGFYPENFDTIVISYNPVEKGILGHWDPPSPGWYTLKLEVNDSNEKRIWVYFTGSPLSQISYPEEGDTVVGEVEIWGSASAPGFIYYRIDYGMGLSPNEWHPIVFSTNPVFDSVLGVWETSNLTEGIYTLKLSIKWDGGTLSDTATVYVKLPYLRGWPVTFEGYTGSSVTVADIDGDGLGEVIFGSSGGLYVWESDGSIKSGWPKLEGEDARSTPAVCDLDNDDTLEIIAITSTLQHSKIYVLTPEGDILNGWPQTVPPSIFAWGWGDPVVEDIDNNGDYEILLPVSNGIIYAFNNDGTSYIPGQNGFFASATGSVWFDSPPTIFVEDIDGDGSNEVIVVWGKANWPSSGIWIWREDGAPYSGSYGYFWPIGRVIGAASGDIDQDGLPEIVVAGGEDTINVFVIKGDSTLLEGWPVSTGLDFDVWMGGKPAIGDIDGDGFPDIVLNLFGVESGKVLAWNHNGESINPLSPYGIVAETPYCLGSPVLGDVDGDGEVEIVSRINYPFGEEGIMAWERDGSPLPDFPFMIPNGFSLWNIYAPFLTDLNDDGYIDILMAGQNGRVYAWTFDKAFNPNLIPWGTYLHDERNTGRYESPTGIKIKETTDLFTVKLLGPNPVREKTLISVEGIGGEIPIYLYNVCGRRVLVEKCRIGGGKIVFNPKKYRLSSGVYFLRVGSHPKPLKLLIIK
jgi:hypothetical protein